MDTISVARLQQLHPQLRNKALDDYSHACTLVKEGFLRISQGLRTSQEQAAIPSANTHAKPGQSFHEYALAFDACIILDGKLDNTPLHIRCPEVVDYLESQGWEWGGGWKSIKDYPHFQITFGHTWQELLAKHNSGNTFMDGGHEYVNI